MNLCTRGGGFKKCQKLLGMYFMDAPLFQELQETKPLSQGPNRAPAHCPICQKVCVTIALSPSKTGIRVAIQQTLARASNEKVRMSEMLKEKSTFYLLRSEQIKV